MHFYSKKNKPEQTARASHLIGGDFAFAFRFSAANAMLSSFLQNGPHISNTIW